MKKQFILFTTLLLSMVSFSQASVLSFENKTHDFGTIQEADGKVSAIFKYKNTGKTPLVISKVQASCGCTVPSWEKMPIEPGDEGGITVTYNPDRRPGRFMKSIYVYSNATEPQIRLMIKGEVIAKPIDFNDRYPIKVAKAGFQSDIVRFNNIKKGIVGYRIVEVHNFDTKPITITFNNPHSYIHFSANTMLVAPNETSRLHIRLESDECPEWGPFRKEVTVSVNGKQTDFELNIDASISEDFSKMTQQELMKAPIIELSNAHVKFGEVASDKTKKITLKVNNHGIETLKIRSIKNSNPELKVKIDNAEIAGGKATFLHLELNPDKQMPGTYRRFVSLQTNDPKNTYQIINITWDIKQ